MTDIIGVVGSNGNLGSRVVNQLTASGCEVIAYDVLQRPAAAELLGVDPYVQVDPLHVDVRVSRSINEVLATSDVVHWCAPLDATEQIKSIPQDTLLVLHDSVMNNSLRKRDGLSRNPKILGKIGIVHCLMNPNTKVFVADETDGTKIAFDHIADIGLKPEVISIKSHDAIMANSQAVLALVSIAVHGKLNEYNSKGYLTASASELLAALDDRASKWTPATIHSILSNPELLTLIDHMKEIVESNLD